MSKSVGHEYIANILMQRDGCTKAEAYERIDDALRMFDECMFNPSDCEDILAEELGLEPDYIFDLLL